MQNDPSPTDTSADGQGPDHGDAVRDMVIIGGGTAGLVAAVGSAGVGAIVTLIERDRTGGDCLWTGCVPSKSLIEAAQRAHDIRTASELGITAGEPEIDFAKVMAHVHGAIHTIQPIDSPERLREEGVEVLAGDATFTDANTVVWTDAAGATRSLRFRTAVIATGARAVLPPVPGLDTAGALTNHDLWDLTELPDHLLVIGGGAIGCELGQAFRRLGAEVTIVEMADRLLTTEEPEASAVVLDSLRADGVTVHLDTRVTGAGPGRLELDGPDAPTEVVGSHILVAAGRRPNTETLGLDAIGVETDRRGAVVTDETLRTSVSHIFAAGDVTGREAFTHVAGHHGGLVVTNALFGLRRKIEQDAIPWAIFTDPEVGHVGLTEAQARERHGDDVIVSTFDHAELDRAITSGDTAGFSKLIGTSKGKLVGATVVGTGAADATAELVQVIAGGGTFDTIGRRIHAYPTHGEGPYKAALAQLRTKYFSDTAVTWAGRALSVMRKVRNP